MIQVNQLSKTYNGTTVLKIENLEIPKGQSFGLVGNNGAGKTNILEAISLLTPWPTASKIPGLSTTSILYCIIKEVTQLGRVKKYYKPTLWKILSTLRK